MAYDKALVAGKLRRWEKYLQNYRLPDWDEIPNFGLYMEQVTALLQEYLDYLPPELKEEQFITAATINNYVRIKVMPEPIKRRYYRSHIAYLIIILTLKHSLSIALIQKLIPLGLSEEELREVYTGYAARHRSDAACPRGHPAADRPGRVPFLPQRHERQAQQKPPGAERHRDRRR